MRKRVGAMYNSSPISKMRATEGGGGGGVEAKRRQFALANEQCDQIGLFLNGFLVTKFLKKWPKYLSTIG